MPSLDIHPASPTDDAARALSRDYLAEVIGRYHGRALTAAELDEAVVEFAIDDLVAPRGALLVAWRDGDAAGCVGVRLRADAVGEVVRVFVRAPHRRRGVARALLAEVEALALEHGLRELRLDTRHDLTESRQLYAAVGYRETEPWHSDPHAEHWFAKSLPTPARAPGSEAASRRRSPE